MNNEIAILQGDSGAQSVFATVAAMALRDMALGTSALIGKVTNAQEQERAVEAQTELHALRQQAEKARTALKRPVIDYGKLIEKTCADFVAPLDEELLRVATLVGDFQQLEMAKAAAARKSQDEALSHLERDRATELAAATSHEEMDAIQAKYADKALLLSQQPAAMPARAAGQVVKTDWDIKVTDIWALARAHPLCVKIDPRVSEIKNLLDAGVKVSGVAAERVQKASVRVSKQPTITV